MPISKTKVAIIGAGNVGTICAYTILGQGVCDEIVLVDLNREKAYAEALDMQHAVYFMDRNTRIYAGDYEDVSDADILIITASAPTPKSAKNRLEMLAPTMKIMRAIITSVMKVGFNGKIIVISNPVDIMTYYAWKLSGLDASCVMGTGTTLDSARLCVELGEMCDVKPRDVNAYILGEHGDSEIAAWSTANIGGRKIDEFLSEDKHCDMGAIHNEVLNQTINSGWEIWSRKGNTSFGIASSTAAMVKSLLSDNAVVLPVSSLLTGQFGIDGVYLSIPCVIDHTGIRQALEPNIADKELEALRKSADLLQSFYEDLDV